MTLYEKVKDRIRIYKLNKKYPFLKVYSFSDGKQIKGITYFDQIPTGWRKAFGQEFIDELNNHLKQYKLQDKLEIQQIKEKYGTLRFYFGMTAPCSNEVYQEIHTIVNKYEGLSGDICIFCGKPATHTTKGWIMPICNECDNKRKKDKEWKL